MMCLVLCKWVDGFKDLNATAYYNVNSYGVSATETRPLMVGLTLIKEAAAKGAGTL